MKNYWYLKKKEYKAKGIKLTVHDKRKKTILTAAGKLTYKRRILIPADSKSYERLYALESKKIVAPLDDFLGIDDLPFKMTTRLMLDIAKLSIQFCSYKQAEKIISEKLNEKISSDLIREVTNFVGMLVYSFDTKYAKSRELLEKKYKNDSEVEGYFLVEMDGSFVHIRDDSGKNPQWCEVKVGFIANSNDFRKFQGKDGREEIKLGKREYVCYLGNVHEFKKYLLAICIKNNYSIYKDTVVLSDGAEWIKSIKKECRRRET